MLQPSSIMNDEEKKRDGPFGNISVRMAIVMVKDAPHSIEVCLDFINRDVTFWIDTLSDDE